MLAVYRGAPGDYAQVVDIPADVLLVPDDQGRYRVERGEQVTVVTAAQLPSGWTRFRLNRTPLPPPEAVADVVRAADPASGDDVYVHTDGG